MTAKWVAIFPIVCVVLMVIALFLPIMHIAISIPVPPFIIEGDVLPLGGGLLDELEPYTALVPEAVDLQIGFMWVGIVFAIFFGLDALFTVITAIRVMTGNKELKKARKKWLRGGISKIISQVIVIVSMTYYIPDLIANLGPGLGMVFTIGLGMIMPIVVGGILIFTWLIAKIAD